MEQMSDQENMRCEICSTELNEFNPCACGEYQGSDMVMVASRMHELIRNCGGSFSIHETYMSGIQKFFMVYDHEDSFVAKDKMIVAALNNAWLISSGYATKDDE